MNVRRLIVSAGAGLMLAATVLAPSGPVAASGASPSPSPGPVTSPGTVTYGLGPATNGKLDLRTGFRLLTTRGGTVTDQVAVVNLSNVPVTLNLYAVDAVNGVDGTIGLKAAADAVVDSAGWVSFRTPSGKGYVSLKPKQTLFVPFSVTVPKNAPVGDHLAGVVVSTVATGQAPGDRAAAVTLEQRVALKLAVRVAGQLTPELTVEGVAASYSGSANPIGRGTATVTYTVRNTGNVRLGGAQEVQVTGVFGGETAASAIPDIPLLLPGGSAAVTVPVEGVLPLGIMTAAVTVVPLPAEGDANAPAPVVNATATFWAIPWLLIALLLVIAALLAIWRRRLAAVPGSHSAGRLVGAPDSVLVGSDRPGTGRDR